jgi:tRNA threonylcarbamoyladenosine biosynthesis protein TsaB
MANILSIDTSDNKIVKVGLQANGKIELAQEDARKLKSQTILILISKVLEENNVYFKDLTEIKVNTGPGSFTGLRVGISIANALSYLLKIPVNGKIIGEIEMPVYN